MEADIAEIPGFPRYRVTRFGDVLSARGRGGKIVRWHKLKPSVVGKGYFYVSLFSSRGGPRTQFYVHRLVASAFIPQKGEGYIVRHLDGNPRNNAADNLAWGTYADNENDKIRHGTWNARYGGKLDISARTDIRNRLSAGQSTSWIASIYGVSITTIQSIRNGKHWKIDL